MGARHAKRAAGRFCGAWILALAVIATAGCASKDLVLELQGSVMYEKPRIAEVSYTVADARRDGGTVTIEVRMNGDPGLAASFDISPGIAEFQAMTEVQAGEYAGEYSFPRDFAGGPYTIIGRLRHDRAGEVTLKDPDPLTISLFR